MVTSTGGLIVRTGRGAVTLRGTVAAGGLVIGVATCSVAACQRYSASEGCRDDAEREASGRERGEQLVGERGQRRLRRCALCDGRRVGDGGHCGLREHFTPELERDLRTVEQ